MTHKGRRSALRGSLITLRRRCGKPNCHCATGQPHSTPARSFSHNVKPFLASAGDKVTISMARDSEVAPMAVPPETAPLRIVHLAPDEVKRRLAWQDLKLQFEEASRGAIAGEFNRYNQRQILIVDEALAATEFGGTFRGDDTESIISMLKSNFGVVVDRQSDKVILIASH